MKPCNDNGELQAEFSVEVIDGVQTVVLESSGGETPTMPRRNPDYTMALELLLRRFSLAEVGITQILVDSKRTQKRGLAPSERMLQLGNGETPLFLPASTDFRKERIRICAAQVPIAQAVGAKGGNSTKRIRIFLHGPVRGWLENYLATGSGHPLLIFPPPYIASSQGNTVPPNDGAGQIGYQLSEEDARQRVMRTITARRGQQAFRQALRERYGDACLITGCPLLDVLEAAHIRPYRGDNDNHPENGLLLRGDLHTLFDLDYLGIDPVNLRISLHPVAREAGYNDLHGGTLKCPIERPSQEALLCRWVQHQSRLAETSTGSTPVPVHAGG